jgi:hypothetical protein
MDRAWSELAKGGTPGRHIMSMAIHAVDAAESECRRTLSSSVESVRLNKVAQAAKKLITAINRAPRFDTVHFIESENNVIALAWRASGEEVAKNIGFQPVVVLTTLLDCVVDHATKLQNNSNARIVKRIRKNPQVVAFVRHLAPALYQKTGKKMMGTIARIATVAFDYSKSKSITKQQVESMLR